MKFPVRRGDNSQDAALVQNRLNRLGALLKEDGQFGSGTENALREACAQLKISVVSQVDAPLWATLDALPEPSSLLPTQGVTFIAIEEVSSRQNYDQKFCRPCWPGGDSGITIGIGYDLRFADTATFKRDWQSGLSTDSYNALLPWLKRHGSSDGANSLKNTTQPFAAAWKVFVNLTIPSTVNETLKAFIGYDALPPLCKSALVSLVYNRGTSLEGDRRIEMRVIQKLIASRDFKAVPDQFSAMKRLWPDVLGLRERRDREAALWREGLA